MATKQKKTTTPDCGIFEELEQMLGNVYTFGAPNFELPDPNLMEFYQNIKERKFWIGDVTSELLLVSKLIMRYNIIDKDIPVEQRKPIKLFIYSYGGDGNACLSIIDAIKLSKTPVYTYNMGQALSAGFLILISGHKRFCMKNSTALLHSGSGGAQGTYEAVEAQTKDYRHFIDVTRQIVLNSTKIDLKLLNKKKTSEWYIYADEQQKLGIVDQIIESIEELF